MKNANPRYVPGERVRAVQNLFNDGTLSEQPAHALLVRRGEAGDIVRVVRNGDTGAVVYLVEFALNQIVGCWESELMPWCSSVRREDEDKLWSGALHLSGPLNGMEFA
jgi:nitrogen fixation protein NifZ